VIVALAAQVGAKRRFRPNACPVLTLRSPSRRTRRMSISASRCQRLAVRFSAAIERPSPASSPVVARALARAEAYSLLPLR
jgi:hypothetical protein